MKLEVTASVVFTIAVTLLSLGIDLLKSGDTSTGSICVIVGFGLLVVGVLAVEWGVIQRVRGESAGGRA